MEKKPTVNFEEECTASQENQPPLKRTGSLSREPYYPNFPSFHSAFVSAVSHVGQRNLAWIGAPCVSSSDTVCYFDVEHFEGAAGLVALTIDDAPCRQGEKSSMLPEVRAVLTEFGARATFFLVSENVPGYEDQLAQLIVDGHEVANHCKWDHPYNQFDEEDFEEHLLEAEEVCQGIRQRASEMQEQASRSLQINAINGKTFDGASPPQTPTTTDGASLPLTPDREHAALESDKESVKWFRAPGAVLSSTMYEVLQRHGFTHVLGDCYANDPWVSDPNFIASTMLEQAMEGSILIIHMPERGFRDYCLGAMRILLEGLQQRGLQVVTLTELRRAATASTYKEPPPKLAPSSYVVPDSWHSVSPGQHCYRYSNPMKAVLAGTTSIVTSAVDAVSGLLLGPIRGAEYRGAIGVFTGTFNGALGVGTHLLSGVFTAGGQVLGGFACPVKRAAATLYYPFSSD